MQKPESKFQTRINKRIPSFIHRQKMGSAMHNGTADFWYSSNRSDLWVEYKWTDRLPVRNIDPRTLISSLQLLWLGRRHYEGRNVCVIIGSPTLCAILEHMTWTAPVYLNQFQYNAIEIADWITERVYAPSEVSSERCFSYKPDL